MFASKYHATDIELLCCSSIKVIKQGFLKKNIIQNLDISTSREQRARAIKTQGNLKELWSRRWDKGDFKRWNWEVRRKRSRLKGFSCGIIWVYIMMKKTKWCLSTFFFSYSSSCSHRSQPRALTVKSSTQQAPYVTSRMMTVSQPVNLTQKSQWVQWQSPSAENLSHFLYEFFWGDGQKSMHVQIILQL